MNQTKLVYEFGPYRLDVDERCLLCADQVVPLTPKAFDLLLALVEHHGSLVEREELLKKVWPGTFVEPANLFYTISLIRKALGDGENGQRYIETRPKRGYLFIADVQELKAESSGLTEPVLAASDGTRPAAVPETEVVFIEPPPAQLKWRRWLWLAAALPVILIVLLAVRIWSALTPHTPQPRPPGVRLQEMRQVSSGVIGATKPMFSPDGKVVLYVSWNLYLAPLAGGEDLQITKDIYATGDMPVFTADGSAVVFSSHRGGADGSRLPDLWMVPALGGTPKLFLTAASGAGFSPDGERVAYTKHTAQRQPLWVSPVNHLEEHQEVSELGFTPRWSPDGRWLAFTTSDPNNGGAGAIWAVSADSLSARRQLTGTPQQVYGLTWCADSKAVIFAAGVPGNFHLFQVSLDGQPPQPLTFGAGDYVAPTVSPDGKALAFAHTSQAWDLMLAEGLTTLNVEGLTRGEYHQWPRLSPSGERVVTVVHRRDFNEYLDLIDLRTKKRRRVSDRPARHPCWLDEDHPAYLSSDSAARATEVRVADLTTGVNSVLTRFPGEANWLAVNPDRKRLAVVLKSPEGRRSVVLRDLEKSPDLTLAEGADYEELRWLPDGKSLCWSGPMLSAEAASNGVWVVKPREGLPRRLVPDGYAPVWSADGASVYFHRYPRQPDNSALWRLELRSNSQSRVRALQYPSYYDLVGKRLIFTQISNRGQVYSVPLR